MVKEEKLINLKVESGVDQNCKPTIRWTFDLREGFYSVAETRARSHALTQAAIIAQVEARVIMSMMEAQSSNSLDTLRAVVHIVRSDREKLPFDLNPIFGVRTKLPLVECNWYGEVLSLRVNEAIHHATVLLEAAESSESDAFLNLAFEDAALRHLDRVLIIDLFKNYRKEQEKN
jgi:hypothetical protein